MSEIRRRTLGRPKSSWVWEFFDLVDRDGVKWAVCKLDKPGEDTPCKKEYKTGGSTKNCIEHLLNKHGLSKDGKEIQVIIYLKFKHIIYFILIIFFF